MTCVYGQRGCVHVCICVCASVQFPRKLPLTSSASLLVVGAGREHVWDPRAQEQPSCTDKREKENTLLRANKEDERLMTYKSLSTECRRCGVNGLRRSHASSCRRLEFHAIPFDFPDWCACVCACVSFCSSSDGTDAVRSASNAAAGVSRIVAGLHTRTDHCSFP